VREIRKLKETFVDVIYIFLFYGHFLIKLYSLTKTILLILPMLFDESNMKTKFFVFSRYRQYSKFWIPL